MSDPKPIKPDTGDLIRKIHERPQMPLVEWLRAPAHVHYKAFRMVDPPVQRPASRDEFKSLLEAFKVSEDMKAIHESVWLWREGGGDRRSADSDLGSTH